VVAHDVTATVALRRDWPVIVALVASSSGISFCDRCLFDFIRVVVRHVVVCIASHFVNGENVVGGTLTRQILSAFRSVTRLIVYLTRSFYLSFRTFINLWPICLVTVTLAYLS